MNALTPPIKWHGGKHYLAARMIALMPPHIHYVEPYFGGGAVLLAKDPEGISEVVNDLNHELTDFWRCLAEPSEFRDFLRIVNAIPFSEYEWRASGESCERGRVARAVAFFVQCRQSLAGRMKDFAALSRTRTRRGMNEQASAWLTAIEGLPAVHARLKRVVILNRPALEVICSQDGPDTLFYCDPPYLHETRASTGEYAFEMSEADHMELLDVLLGIEGKAMVSGYRSDLYDDKLEAWQRIDFDLPNNSAGGNTKRRMTECLWIKT